MTFLTAGAGALAMVFQEQRTIFTALAAAFLLGALYSLHRAYKARDDSARVQLYRHAHAAVNSFVELGNACSSGTEDAMHQAERQFREHLGKVTDALAEADLRLAAKYSDPLEDIRTILSGPEHIFNKVNELNEPVNRLRDVLSKDHRWDRKRSGIPGNPKSPA